MVAVMKTQSFKQFIYFQKRTYVFIMHGISTGIRDSFVSAGYWGVCCVQADGNKSKAISSFGKDIA
jgi:hypothetical protein